MRATADTGVLPPTVSSAGIDTREREVEDEGGFVLVLVAISITVLLGLAGFSVDLGNWYLHVDKAQAAADAAALAGAVYLPGEPDKAVAAAQASMLENNVPQSNIDAAIIRPVAAGSGDLYVSFETDVRNIFIPFVGFSQDSHFRVVSTARWQPGLGIGDYSNVLGTEPPDASRPNNDQWESAERKANQGQFWLAVDGGQSEKQNGDRFGAQHCNAQPVASGCAGGANTEQNVDPDGLHTGGYEFVVQADKGLAGTALQVQVYDPAMAETGNECDVIADLGAGGNPRYQAGKNPFCNGDSLLGEGGPSAAYYQLFNAKTGQPADACPAERVFQPWTTPLSAHVANPEFVAQFHEWFPLCNLSYDPVNGSSYILRVRTDLDKGGQNMFSLRVGLFNGPTGPNAGGTYLPDATQAGVRVFAKKDLPVFANFDGANTQFAIASIPPSYAGQDVTLSLFDLGDAGAPGVLSVISSSTAEGGSATTNCDWQPPNSNTAEALTNCEVPNVQNTTGFQGQTFTITWHVPDTYACDMTGVDPAANCFLFLKLAYPEGTRVTDRTTWSAGGKNQPLRLVNPPKRAPAE